MRDTDSHDEFALIPADAAAVFTDLAKIIYEDPEPAEMYGAICSAAAVLVPGCDHVSVMMRRDGDCFTIAATDETARHVDALERATGQGPCLDAIEEEGPHVEPDLLSSTHWPNFAARVTGETPIRGVMGFRLLVDDRKTGALNLFSETPNRFDLSSVASGIVLAAFASVSANATARGEDMAILRRGVRINREIGKAVGMLMAVHHVSERQAMDMLRRSSQDLNVRLTEVARWVITQRGRVPPHKPRA